MAVVDVLNKEAKKVSQAELKDEIYGVPVKAAILHEVVTMQLAKRRSGTAAVKHRSDVRGSGKKLFRQKGTGRARRGDVKSPLLRGGGSVFGPDPRKYGHAVSKKVRKLALKMALSSKLQDENLLVLDSFGLDEIKTSGFVAVLDALEVKNALIISDSRDKALELSSRNARRIRSSSTRR